MCVCVCEQHLQEGRKAQQYLDQCWKQMDNVSREGGREGERERERESGREGGSDGGVAAWRTHVLPLRAGQRPAHGQFGRVSWRDRV